VSAATADQTAESESARPSTAPRYDDLKVGDELPALTVHITRGDLVRYAGASTDFNVIHWSDRIAAEVGLPGVIAHGMLTMAQAARVVTDWVGDPAAITEFSVRFAKPVLVPDDDKGAEVVFGGRVAALLDDGVVRVDLTATCDGERVLSAARAFVRLT
jgi:acyl dehydratase